MKKEIVSSQITMESFILCPFLVAAAYPTCQSGVNVSTISYTGVLSELPPIIGLAIKPGRLIHRLIREAGEFTLSLPSLELLKDLDFCGTFSGQTHCKIFLRKIEMEAGVMIKTPTIKRSPLVLECLLKNILRLSEEGASHDYFIANVVAARQEEDFQIEKCDGLVTANYDYRLVGQSLGQAFHCWRKE